MSQAPHIPHHEPATAAPGVRAVPKQKPTAQELALPPIPPRDPAGGPPDISAIVAAACFVLKVPAPNLRTNSRHMRVVAARRVISRLAREETCLSYPEIAPWISLAAGHTTAIEGEKKLARELDQPVPFPVEGVKTWGDLVDKVRGMLP